MLLVKRGSLLGLELDNWIFEKTLSDGSALISCHADYTNELRHFGYWWCEGSDGCVDSGEEITKVG